MHGGHDHSHSSAPENYGRAFAIAIGLNFALVAAQVVYGLYAHSLALLADAGHNFGDAMGLGLAWGAYAIADWRPSRHYTYRLRAASILSASPTVSSCFSPPELLAGKRSAASRS